MLHYIVMLECFRGRYA